MTDDLLVVGAGPAGATLAALASERGMRVTLIDRATFPRDKVCGEFVSAEGCRVLERIGVLAPLIDAGARSMDACRITAPGAPTLSAELPALARGGRAALGISRRVMDHRLVELACRRGARLIERCRAVDVHTDASETVRGLVVRERPTDRVRTLQARIVVAADGRRSLLSRRFHPRLGDPRSSGPRSWYGLKTHLALRDAARDRIELHLFDGGYAGLGAIEDGRTNLCLMITRQALRAFAGSPDRVLGEALPREIFAGATRLTPWQAIGPLRFGARRGHAAGALFVGDAAGTVDPYCGEGMSHALRAAELAAPVLERAAAAGGLTPNLGAEYQRRWNDEFAAATRRVRRIGRLLEHPRLARVALHALRFAGRPLTRRLVAATRTG